MMRAASSSCSRSFSIARRSFKGVEVTMHCPQGKSTPGGRRRQKEDSRWEREKGEIAGCCCHAHHGERSACVLGGRATKSDYESAFRCPCCRHHRVRGVRDLLEEDAF